VEPVPSTVFGLAAYNGEAHIAEAIESLLSQTRSDLAVVVVDDASTDGTAQICARYARHDSRVSYSRNERQLGLSRNWQRAFELAGERHRAAPYFAWASDHDVWGPRWHERLASELESHDEAVLAYPLSVRVDDFGSEYPTRERLFDTAGVTGPDDRVRWVAGELRGAGELVYGLMRRTAVDRSGPFPVAMLADRLFLVRLAAEGEFRQVRERLWYRRFRAGVRMTNARQRRAAFPDGAPLSAYAPWWITHPLTVGRGYGATLARESLRTAYGRKIERVRRNLRWRKRHALERLGLRERPVPSPVLERTVDIGEAVHVVSPGEVSRLYEEGFPEIYAVDATPELCEAFERYYWLRRPWLDRGGRKPDPTDGPVPQGESRYLVGRRRLVPESRG
jgi:glycosyltransferase involved in cell wall biosynthesis